MQSGSELQLETERSRRPLAGVNSTLTGDLAANPLQMQREAICDTTICCGTGDRKELALTGRRTDTAIQPAG